MFLFKSTETQYLFITETFLPHLLQTLTKVISYNIADLCLTEMFI